MKLLSFEKKNNSGFFKKGKIPPAKKTKKININILEEYKISSVSKWRSTVGIFKINSEKISVPMPKKRSLNKKPR